MTYLDLFFAAFFCCVISMSMTNATETSVIHIPPGGNAELTLSPDNLTSLTVCSSVYTISSARLQYPILTMSIQNEWISLKVYSFSEQIGVAIFKGSKSLINGQLSGPLFALQWVMFCLSLDSLSGRVRLTFDTKLVLDEIHEDIVSTKWSLFPITLRLGDFEEDKSKRVSNVNLFASALPVQRMKGLTEAGGAECGAPGDFLNWEEANLTLNSNCTRSRVDPREGPCWVRSQVHVYSGNWKQPKCMQHCKKVGGRSPAVGTLLQWQNLKTELKAITNQTGYFRSMWLPLTVGESYAGPVVGGLRCFDHLPENRVPSTDVWRDYYTGEQSESFSVVPSPSNDGNCYCILVTFSWSKETEEVWTKTFCSYPDEFSCACQSRKHPPMLRLQGICGASTLRGTGSDRTQGLLFTPRQSNTDPSNLFFVSRRGVLVEFSETEDKWMITDATSNFTATSRASKRSYVLGKHNWTFQGDPMCSEKQYAVKMTSCSYATQFTCHDGQCISMDGRCDHLLDCDDRYIFIKSSSIHSYLYQTDPQVRRRRLPFGGSG